MKNKIYLSLVAMFMLTFTACQKDEIDFLGILNQQEVPALTVQEVDDQLVVTWPTALYEHLGSYVVTNTYTSEVKEVEPTAESTEESCVFDAVPGLNVFVLSLKDTQGNLSETSAPVEYRVYNVADVFTLIQEEEAGTFVVYKNGEATSFSLDNTMYPSLEVIDMAVSGSDVFLCGSYTNEAGKYVAAYWHNGEETTLQNVAEYSSYAKSIDVFNGHVYVLGNDMSIDSYNHIIKVWEDGVAVDINETGVYSKLTSGNCIEVNENGTFIGYSYYDASWNDQLFANIDGAESMIGGPYAFGDTNVQLPGAVAGNDTHAYVLGYSGYFTIDEAGASAFTDLGGYRLHGMELAEDGVHVVGATAKAGSLGYWAPAATTPIILNEGVTNEKFNFVEVYQGDVFVVGTIKNAEDLYNPVFFINGEVQTGGVATVSSTGNVLVRDMEVIERPF